MDESSPPSEKPTHSVPTSNGIWNGETRVDLGDDLLSEPKVAQFVSDVSEQKPEDESFESAEILYSEGLVDDAKQILRKILIQDPSHAVAHEFLHQIHEKELQDILEGRQNFRKKNEPKWIPTHWGDDQSIHLLEKALNLEESPLEILQVAVQEEIYAEELLRQLKDASARDFIDSGIGFLQMGLGRTAAILFSNAAKRDALIWVEAKVLEAQGWFMAGEKGESAAVLQGLLPRVQGLADDRITVEVYYWLGRVEEAEERIEAAQGYYQAAIRLDSTHRDLMDRWVSVVGAPS